LRLAERRHPTALDVIQELMDNSSNDRVRLAAAQFIIERGYGRAPERIELLDAREQGPLPGAELPPVEAYMQLIKYKTYEEMQPFVGAQSLEEGDFRVIDLDG
jgi:hypothetical protein